MAEFVHLHLHTQYSLLDGMIKPGELMDRCHELGMKSVAITDHGNMYGILNFYKIAKKAGIKPIIGCEVYVAHGDRTDHTAGQPSPYHLVLLAENETGYRNLVKIVSKAHVEGFYYRPRCDKSLLEVHNEGLVALSACLQGEIPRLIRDNKPKEAREAVEYYRDLFKDRFYLELQDNGMQEQYDLNDEIIKLSKEFSLPIVATNDSHYLTKDQASSHELLLCIQTNKTTADANRMKFPTDAFYVKSPDEMAASFKDHPEALKNTMEIAERCNVEFDFNQFIYPHYEIEGGLSPQEAFENMARTGLEKFMPMIIQTAGPDTDPVKLEKDYKERLEEEIDLINLKGFASYFLIVQDFMNWARDNDIPVGPGRGSAAGSLVSFVVGITDIDPIRYGLLFERFLNPDRKDNPDIDCDFCAEGRDQVIDYVTRKYGKDCVAQIATFGTLKAKAAIRDVGRAMAHTYGEVDRIAKLIPDELGIKLKKAVEQEKELKKAIDDYSWVAELMEHAQVVEGLSRHISTHAAGVVIANKDLTEYLPICTGSKDEIITQWDKKGVESIGLIKFDFLGLKTLTVIKNALKFIEQVHGKKIDMLTIPMDDPKAFQLLAQAQTTGVFQLESRGMKELLRRLEPSKIEDLIALVALYRPGPIESGMIDQYINCAKGLEEVRYELPILEEHLKETFGMMVYQEQVMQVASAVAGFSLGQADLLRRAMSKKNLELMAEYKVDFIKGANERDFSTEKAEIIWDQIEKFAKYGFNKSHSAAYAVVSYQTAYLKANYPVEFMAAVLTMDADNSDKLMTSIAETREMGIDVLPPDVNESGVYFTVHKDTIRYGLAGVKNVGVAAVEAMIEAREKVKGFLGLLDFCEKVDLKKINRRVIESLIKAGAFDSVNPNRALLFRNLDYALERAARIQREADSGQMGLFGGGKKPQRRQDDFEACEPWGMREQLDLEKEVLGFYLTGHPLQEYKDKVQRFSDYHSQDLKELPPNKRFDVRLAGIITARKYRDTARGRMAICTFEDLLGHYDVVVYAQACERCDEKIRSDSPILLKGKAERDPDRGVRVVADEMFYLKDAEKLMSHEVHIHLKGDLHEKSHIERLRDLFKRSPGKCRAIIHVEIPGKSMVTCKLAPRFGLDPSDEMLKEAEGILGPNVISFR